MLPVKNQTDFEALTAGARVLEEDVHGIKVLLLPDDRILKLFRRKRLLSSQIWSPLVSRFQKNAEMLTRKGIPTITVSETFKAPHLERQCLLYQAIPGETMRDWLQQHEGSELRQKMEAYGAFVARIHASGVLFRSLHLGNVLVTEEGTLALIDIADIRFCRFGALSLAQRKRNFRHMTRYAIDRKLLSQASDSFFSAYFEKSGLSEKARSPLLAEFRALLALQE